MSRPAWIAPAYGYLVCLISVITFLVSVSNFASALIDRANPIQAANNRFGGPSLSSFEAFRATFERPTRTAPANAGSDTLSTAEMRSRYEALRSDRIAQVNYTSTRTIVSFAMLMLVSIGFFVLHWRWVRALRDAD